MKLIDILNKIANGELKEGTKVIYDEETYTFNDENELERELGFTLLDDIYMNNLSDEVELIEPQEPKECEHEWQNYTRHRIGEGTIRRFRRCDKCGLEEEIEPTDNTKIEELDKYNCGMINEYNSEGEVYARGFDLEAFREDIIEKLNEVIRYINK